MQSDKFYLNSVKVVNYTKVIVFSFLPLIAFPWQEPYLFTRQVKLQIWKSTWIIIYTKEEMPTLVGIKHLSVHFSPEKPRLFHLSTEKIRAWSIKKFTSRCLFPHWHNIYWYEQKITGFSWKVKYYKVHQYWKDT